MTNWRKHSQTSHVLTPNIQKHRYRLAFEIKRKFFTRVYTHMYESSRLRIQAHQGWPTESCNMSPVFPNVTLNDYKDSGALLTIALQWQHERDGVANHRCPNYSFKHLFRRRSEKISKLCVTGLCEGNQPVTGGSAHMGWVTGKMCPFSLENLCSLLAAYFYANRTLSKRICMKLPQSVTVLQLIYSSCGTLYITYIWSLKKLIIPATFFVVWPQRGIIHWRQTSNISKGFKKE